MTPDAQPDLTPAEPPVMASDVRAVSIVVVVVLVIGLVTAIALTRGGADERLATVTGTTDAVESSPTVASPSTIEVGISDEPIRIDADGTITDGTAIVGTIASTDPSKRAETSDESDPDSGRTDADDGLNLLGGDDPEDRKMPDVVCLGLQRAQDEIQDRGVFGSKSVDATGAGRRQIWDRNWIVIAQDPAPGEPIGEFEAVLSVVKTDEEHPC